MADRPIRAKSPATSPAVPSGWKPMLLNPLAASDEFVPIALEDTPQTHQRGKAWKVITSFNALNMTRACIHTLSQLFLYQLSPRRFVVSSRGGACGNKSRNNDKKWLASLRLFVRIASMGIRGIRMAGLAQSPALGCTGGASLAPNP